MLGDRKFNDKNAWQNGSAVNSRVQGMQTPRGKAKPTIPLPNSRKSMTPSRVQERVNASPLRMPLESAIQKISRNIPQERAGSRSRVSQKTSRKQGDSIVLRRGFFQEQENKENNVRSHAETVTFIKKYFDFQNYINIDSLIDCIIREYQDLWTNQQVHKFIGPFTQRIYEIFNTENINPRELIYLTRQDGMIGLIIETMKAISNVQPEPVRNNSSSYVCFSKSPNVMSINKSFEEQVNQCINVQSLKNVIQEFMEIMYQEMEKQIYNKFNVEMKRLVLKYREADRILKKINEKLTMNADYFQAEQKWTNKWKSSEESNTQLKKCLEKLQDQLKKQKQLNAENKLVKTRLEEQNTKLKENVQKYQNILISKLENLPNSQSTLPSLPSMNSLSRKYPSNGALLDRTQQFNNQNNSFISQQPQKPFQITIDTQIIHRDIGPPLTQTKTMFTEPLFNNMNQNQGYLQINQGSVGSPSYSPIKFNGNILDSHRPSFDSAARPKVGEYAYSPYQSRVSRPL